MKSGSLRSRMFAGIMLAILCPAILMCAMMGFLGYRQQRTLVEKNLLILADARKQQLISIQQGREHDLELFIKLPLFNTEMRNYLRRTDLTGVAKSSVFTSDSQQLLISKAFRDLNKTHRRFKNIFLLDLKGNIVASSDPALLWKNQAGEFYFANCLRLARQPVSVTHAEMRKQGVVIQHGVISIAVREQTSELLGVLAGEARLNDFSDALTHVAEVGGGSFDSYLMDNRRTLITPMRDPKMLPGVTILSDPVVPQAHRDGVAHLATYRNHAGKTVLGSYTWLAPLEILIVAEEELDEIYAPVTHMLLLTGGMALVTLLLIIAMALVFIGRVTKPVAHLAGVAEQIAAGKLDLRADESAFNELTGLSRAFNSMTEQLQANMRGLEERVTELQIAKLKLTDYADALESENAERKKAIEERDRMESKMLQSQKLESLGVLAGGIAHDFNNLLTGIMGNTDLLLYRTPPEAPDRPLLEQVMAASQRAAELTRQMLAYSGKGRFVVQPTRLGELVRELEPLLQLSISKRSQLTLQCEGAQPVVEADQTQVRQVVMNLVSNASEAMDDAPGEIIVRTAKRTLGSAELEHMLLQPPPAAGEFAVIEVQDSGHGMSGETIARIFDPFFTTKFTGRGLGLAAVLGIVRGHGGSIGIESSRGGGSRFAVYIPVSASAAADDPSSTQGAAPRQAPAKGFKGQGTVLLVDDEPAIRSVAGLMLQSLGYKALHASNGAEGLDMYDKHAAEIVLAIVDLTMPVMDGETMLRELRPKAPDLKILLSSGYSEESLGDRYAACDGFIAKPYSLAGLAEALRKCFEKSA